MIFIVRHRNEKQPLQNLQQFKINKYVLRLHSVSHIMLEKERKEDEHHACKDSEFVCTD